MCSWLLDVGGEPSLPRPPVALKGASATTLNATMPLEIGVRSVIRMPFRAVRLFAASITSTSAGVFRVRYGLQMLRVNASPMLTGVATRAQGIGGVTGVIPLKTSGWTARQEMIDKSASSIYGDVSVAAAPESAYPSPAIIRPAWIDVSPETNHGGPVSWLVEWDTPLPASVVFATPAASKCERFASFNRTGFGSLRGHRESHFLGVAGRAVDAAPSLYFTTEVLS